jgi:hypothetical protein
MDLAHFSRYLFVEVLRQEVCSCSVGFRPTLIAGHQISDFGVGFQPLPQILHLSVATQASSKDARSVHLIFRDFSR